MVWLLALKLSPLISEAAPEDRGHYSVPLFDLILGDYGVQDPWFIAATPLETKTGPEGNTSTTLDLETLEVNTYPKLASLGLAELERISGDAVADPKFWRNSGRCTPTLAALRRSTVLID